MDKNAIKKYAVWARRELIERVAKKALQYGIEEKSWLDVNVDSISGKLLTASEKKQRQALVAQINDKGYEQVMEEVAYTWFNRFSALRFMEVNGYLPTHVRVFTDESNNFKPQILAEAIHLEMDGLDMDKVFELKDANQTDELYKYLLIAQCNSLNEILPGMFQKISDYTELLLPDNLLREGSVIEQMITLIEEEDWKDAVQIIGWLYQYYNSEKKDEVFSALKKNVKITRENIPAATQLFTPDWIVRYMVENSLGRLWLEGHPNDGLKSDWKYYLEEAEQEAKVQAQLDTIRDEYKNIKPEEIKCIDPCSGSGHILAYMFDVLVQIYESYGYTTREAVTSIVKNNIYGLDIDERAAQLANFAVMMKARQYDRRFFAKKDEEGNLNIPQPHVYAICESNFINSECLDYFAKGDIKLNREIHTLVDEMYDAKEYGSMLNLSQFDYAALLTRINEIKSEEVLTLFSIEIMDKLLPIIRVASILSNKYSVVITNPPYMAISNASEKVNKYAKDNYVDSKSDLFAIFIERCNKMAGKYGFQAMITQHSWMFLTSFENLRKKLMQVNITSMAHLGARAFEEIGGEVVQTTAFVVQNLSIPKYKGTYCRLVQPTTQQSKENLFLSGNEKYVAIQDSFSVIPGSPISYWIDDSIAKTYQNQLLSSIAFSDGQILTGNNNKYLRLLWEVDSTSVSKHGNWCLHAKGGEYRRWYGNIDTVVAWTEKARNHYRKDKIARFPKQEILFRRGITWTLVSMNPNFGVRELESALTFNKAAATILFEDESKINYVIGLLNTKVAQLLLSIINPTMNNNIKDILNMPYIYSKEDANEINELVEENIAISKVDWNSFETSWDFEINPLIRSTRLIADAYAAWEKECDERFERLKRNEEQLNRIFIRIYGLGSQLSPEIENDVITITRADINREVKGLISYAVGCILGRYSLDIKGKAFAGGEWDESKYITFPVDKDNIVPICDDDYFADDILGRFISFIEVVYGSDTLQDNMKFIADVIGGKGQPKDVLRNYFINSFYSDHCRMYQKRPIYWQFDSGKKNGFKCLIYMHRYQPDTIMRIRTDYVHEQQSRYRTAIDDLEQRINGASTSERVKLTKRLDSMQAQAIEIREYEENIHHLADQMIHINLDDGVKSNYDKFKNLLVKI